MTRYFPLVIFSALSVFFTGCGKSPTPASSGAAPATTDSEILVGEYGSMTGDTATFGQSTHKGIQLAADELNAAGGLFGKKVRILLEDDQGQPNQATTAVLKLIERDQVVAVLGEVKSSCSIAAAPICQKYKIPMISPSSTNPEVTRKGDYIFRACFIDPFQGDVMARFAFNTLKARKVAVLTDKSADYSVGLAHFFKEKFTQLGGKIVADESYQAKDKEFKPQLTNIRAAHPDAIFVPGYYTECTLIALQARELGIQVPLLGGDGWDSDATLKNGGKAVEGCFFSNHYHQDDPRPEVQNFIERFKQRNNGEVPDAMAVTGYDAANILFDAMRRAGGTDPSKVRDQIAATKDFAGVSAKITIDAERNAQKSVVVLKIENGRYKFVELVSP